MATTKAVLGIDIGGSGIKGAPVCLDQGDFAVDRLRIPTPTKSTPANVADVVRQIVDHFADQIDADSPIGLTIPAPSLGGVVPFIANLDQKWTGLNADEFFTERVGHPVRVINDADAAGIAEVHYGAAKDIGGLVIMTTLGTGIGTALFYDGVLIPNAELGHLELGGKDAETWAAASVKDKKHLSYKKWAERLQIYYSYLDRLFFPTRFVVGGGVSRDADKFLHLIDVRADIVPATLENRAGIVGAAWHAQAHS